MEVETTQKIGIMGGTFDPVHNGHVMIAENAREQFGLEKVLFIPTGEHSPHKPDLRILDESCRCDMVSLAIADNPYFILDRTEIDSQEVSYTYLTLEKLKTAYPDAQFYFILGADSLFNLEQWYYPKKILESCTVLAAYRTHEKQECFFSQIAYLKEKYHSRIFSLQTPSLDISSREIRIRMAKGQTIRYLVPREVEAYIRRHGLYRSEFKEDKEGVTGWNEGK